MSDPRYPVGPFQRREHLSASERRAMIDQIAAAPARLRDAVRGLDDAQLDTPYRDGGWTLRQVAHHLPDSHMNGFTRLKLALTEDEPVIKPYDESRWASLADVRETPIEVSLTLLDALHTRWLTLWHSLHDRDFGRAFRHPEQEGVLTVDWLLAQYSWHGRHHVAQITSLRERRGW
jgi:uncharacterized damage-inducible protein DinB